MFIVQMRIPVVVRTVPVQPVIVPLVPAKLNEKETSSKTFWFHSQYYSSFFFEKNLENNKMIR